jgi:hypothetical protein
MSENNGSPPKFGNRKRETGRPHRHRGRSASAPSADRYEQVGPLQPRQLLASTRTYIKSHRDTVLRVMKTFVEGLHYYKENKEFVLKVTADFA